MGKLTLIVAGALAALGSPLAAQKDAPERALEPRNKIICKSFPRTGSLISTYRTCKPRWEWERERDNLRTLSVSDSCRSRAEPDPSKAGGGCSL